MEDETIENKQISASSNINRAKEARLNNKDYWRPKGDNQWLQVEFMSIVIITAIQTQGRGDGDKYVEKVEIATAFSDNFAEDSFIKDGDQNIMVSVLSYNTN